MWEFLHRRGTGSLSSVDSNRDCSLRRVHLNGPERGLLRLCLFAVRSFGFIGPRGAGIGFADSLLMASPDWPEGAHTGRGATPVDSEQRTAYGPGGANTSRQRTANRVRPRRGPHRQRSYASKRHTANRVRPRRGQRQRTAKREPRTAPKGPTPAEELRQRTAKREPRTAPKGPTPLPSTANHPPQGANRQAVAAIRQRARRARPCDPANGFALWGRRPQIMFRMFISQPRKR